MNRTTTNRLTVVALLAILLVGCGKTTDKKPVANAVKDTTAHTDSTGAKNDSTLAKTDSTTAKKDSGSVAADTSHAADSVKAPPLPKLTYEQTQGKYVFARYCAVCHGVEGRGDGFNAYNLDPKPRDFTDSGFLSVFPDERLSQVTMLGGHAVNKSQTMPAFEWTIGKDEIGYVVAYVRYLSLLPKPKE
jgi:mono/diheme cytochrome c family protein